MPSRTGSAQCPSASPAVALVSHLNRDYRGSVRDYRRSLHACRHRLSTRAVHDLRVAIRRLSAVLELLRVTQQELPSVHEPLQRQLGALGDLRDAQMQCRRAARTRAVPLLRQSLRKREQRRRKGAEQAVLARKVPHRLKQWRVGAAAVRPQAGPRLRRLLEGRLRRAFDPLAASTPSVPIDPVHRHQVRMKLREFYYLMKALAPAWSRGPALTLLLSHLRGYLQITGEIHDNELLLRRLDRLIADKRLTATSVRPLRRQLLSENRWREAACPGHEQRLFREAILARRVLLKNFPCNSKTKSS
jgi:CHAD domain-containing protein